MTTRDELAVLIVKQGLPRRYSLELDEATDIADAILARWRLVPVEEDYQVAWLTFRNPDGSMRYTTVASGHGDGDWIVNGEVATGYAEVQEIPIGQQHRAADELTHHDQAAGHYDAQIEPSKRQRHRPTWCSRWIGGDCDCK